MPELHQNQIPFNAPDPTHISVGRYDDVWGPLLGNVAKVADGIAQTEAKLADENMKSKINSAMARINSNIDNAKSGTIDYERLQEDSMKDLTATFNQFDDATKSRFLQENPDFFASFELAVGEKVVEKKRKQAVNEVKNMIPYWTSQAMASGDPAEREKVIDKIRDTLQPVATVEEIDDLIFAANSDMDDANVLRLMGNQTPEGFAAVRKFLNNPKESYTISAAERERYLNMVDGYEASYYKALKDKGDIGVDDHTFDMMRDWFNYNMQIRNEEGAEELLRDIYDGKKVFLGYQSVKGKDGMMNEPVYFDTSVLSPTQRTELTAKLGTDWDRSLYVKDAQIRFDNNVDKGVTDLDKLINKKDPVFDVTTVERIEQLKADRDTNPKFWNEMDKSLREKADRYINEVEAAQADMLHPATEPMVFYKGGFGKQNLDTTPDVRIRNLVDGQPYRFKNLTDLFDSNEGIFAAEDAGSKGQAVAISQALETKMREYRENFEPNMTPNSVGKFALYNIGLIDALRGTNHIGQEDSRLKYLDSKTLMSRYSTWANKAHQSGLFDAVASTQDLNTVSKELYTMLLGSVPNEQEMKEIKFLSGIAQYTLPDTWKGEDKPVYYDNGILPAKISYPDKILNPEKVYDTSRATMKWLKLKNTDKK